MVSGDSQVALRRLQQVGIFFKYPAYLHQFWRSFRCCSCFTYPIPEYSKVGSGQSGLALSRCGECDWSAYLYCRLKISSCLFTVYCGNLFFVFLFHRSKITSCIFHFKVYKIKYTASYRSTQSTAAQSFITDFLFTRLCFFALSRIALALPLTNDRN